MDSDRHSSGEHYFTASPASAQHLRRIEVALAGHDLEVFTARGVFSADHLDSATRLLLDHVPVPTPGDRVLDLGCGWGPIALTAALLEPGAEVVAVDVNERALDLVRRNAELIAPLGGAPVTAVAPDQLDPQLRFDLIWSNPPIRIGKQALHDLLLTWLPRLAQGGVARLVVGRNLGADSLQRWLVTQGYRCDKTASAKGFRVFAVAPLGNQTCAD